MTEQWRDANARIETLRLIISDFQHIKVHHFQSRYADRPWATTGYSLYMLTVCDRGYNVYVSFDTFYFMPTNDHFKYELNFIVLLFQNLLLVQIQQKNRERGNASSPHCGAQRQRNQQTLNFL